jgi:hypothetical protein
LISHDADVFGKDNLFLEAVLIFFQADLGGILKDDFPNLSSLS